MFFLFISLIIIFYSFYLYNKFIKKINLVDEAWSGIDVQLKKRYDLVPNLCEVVKSYAKHEKETLEDVIKIRNKALKHEDQESKLKVTSDLKKIIALVESYPELKADKNFRKLQDDLVKIEDDLQYARRYYNGSVRDYRILSNQIPSNLVAKIFNFKSYDFFEIGYATERKNPDINF